MKNIDAITHTRGESIYLDDIPETVGTLHGIVFYSPVAHGLIKKLDVTEALKSEGVVRIFTYKDVPGQNQVGATVADEPLFAEKRVHCHGMRIAFIVAESQEAAELARGKIKIEIDPLPVITDPRDAKAKGELIAPPRVLNSGNIDSAWEACDYIFEGRADSNGQEHLSIETHGAYALPTENNGIKVYSSTQGASHVQHCCQQVLGIPMHEIEVEVIRLGGGFGGKESQADAWGALCALATYHLKRPVKFSLHRLDDMVMTGKRHPYSSDFKIGLNKELKILAYEVTFYQNAGCTTDLSLAVLGRTLDHTTNSYFIPNVRATAYSCKTHLPSNTAFRGFGGPQAMFVIECAIAKAAEELKVDTYKIQRQNLIKADELFPYEQPAQNEAVDCWDAADKLYGFKETIDEINRFNSAHEFVKKGYACMPICFGISFVTTMMNQGRSLVHVYLDGSVTVATGAVEMGQGVNTKILQTVATVFSIPSSKIKVQATSTYKIANTAPSASSTTADLNGKATLLACTAILERLKQVAAEELGAELDAIALKDEKVFLRDSQTELDWHSLIKKAYAKRVSLSEHAHYATPGIHFDHDKRRGHPFAYHVYGTAFVTATVDCMRGIFEIDDVKVVHDVGKSINPHIDQGQCEGAIVQGIGWMTMEELAYNKNGLLTSRALSTYKIPDIYSVPKKISLHFLDTIKDNLALLNSKAVGEPPFMYGIGAYFAVRKAIRAFNPSLRMSFEAPLTHENVLLYLYNQHS